MIGILILSVSCSQERRLANAFIRSGDTTNILFLQPENTIFLRKNLSLADEKKGTDGSDSSSVNATLYIKDLKNKTISDLLYINLTDELRSRPVNVYSDTDMNEFMMLGKRSYIIKIAQLELDESEVPYTASEQFDTLTYYENFLLNSVSVNLWIEVTEVNGTQDTTQVLFCNESLIDEVDGYFTQSFSGRVEYIYSRTDISTDKIYNMVSDFGKTNSDYLYDYFLNKYIHERYKGKKTPKYYHLDTQKGILYPSGYKRYIFM